MIILNNRQKGKNWFQCNTKSEQKKHLNLRLMNRVTSEVKTQSLR